MILHIPVRFAHADDQMAFEPRKVPIGSGAQFGDVVMIFNFDPRQGTVPFPQILPQRVTQRRRFIIYAVKYRLQKAHTLFSSDFTGCIVPDFGMKMTKDHGKPQTPRLPNRAGFCRTNGARYALCICFQDFHDFNITVHNGFP